MRIISGKFGGRKFQPPREMPHTRPTTDIAKQGLFNMLNSRMALDGISTLDLFGGTGAISYELASRGAEHLVVVEKDPIMHAFIQKNMQTLGVTNCQVLRLDIFTYLRTCNQQFDFIFAGPPYALGTIDEIPKIIVHQNLIAEGGYFVLEHTPRNNYETFDGFSFARNYGTTVFSFFEGVKA
ncbi:MAG: RsmD family RNA methyltransferase [Chitinophagaceae bacterium]